MDDVISRQDAIKFFTELWECIGTIGDREEWEDVCVTTANEIKSAQPEPHWIPVSERLPDVDEDGYSDLVLVSFSNFIVPAILEYRKGDNDWYEQTEADGEPGVSRIGLVVNAWMPLTKPYTEDKT